MNPAARERLDGVLASLTTGRPSRADEPVAVDATDRYLLDEAAGDIARNSRGWPSGAAAGGPTVPPSELERPPDERGDAEVRGPVVVIDDRYGALTFGAAALLGDGAPVRVHQDAVTSQRALDRNARALGAVRAADAPGTVRAGDAPGTVGTPETLVVPGGVRYLPLPRPDADLLTGARLVLLRLPRSLAALRDIAERVAAYAAPDVVLYAGGRVKHMTPAMNDVLGESFGDVRATLARSKSRLIVARAPRPSSGFTYPVRRDTDVGLAVCAYGAAFAGASLDVGTRFLLAALAGRDPGGEAPVHDAVDLGCGTGLLAAWAARRWPDARVVATDRSTAAVRSAALTARANGVGDRVIAVADDVAGSLAEASADIVLLNPPFHDDAALRTDTAHRMFAAAHRLLRPGGVLWCVWNSHLRYRAALERTVGPTEQVARDPKFTVTRSTRR